MKWKRRGMVFMMNDFKAYLRYYVNSNKRLLILVFIILFLIMPFFTFNYMGLPRGPYSLDTFYMGFIALGAATCAGGCILSYLLPTYNFRYLYKKRSHEMYFSLPIQRKHLFLYNYISGLLVLLVPLLMNYLLGYFIMLGLGYRERPLYMLIPLIFFLGLSILLLIQYSIFTFLSVKCNNLIDSILVNGAYVVMPFIVMLSATIFFSNQITAILGDIGASPSEFINMGMIQMLLSMPSTIYAFLFNMIASMASEMHRIDTLINAFNWLYFLYWGVIGVLCFWFGWKSFVDRKPEDAEQRTVTLFGYPVIITVITFCMVLFVMNINGGVVVPSLIILVAYFCMIFFSNRKIQIKKLHVIVFALLYIGTFGFSYMYTQTKGLGMVKEFPSLTDMKRVNIDVNSSSIENDSAMQFYDAKNKEYYDGYGTSVQDEESMKDLLDVQKEVSTRSVKEYFYDNAFYISISYIKQDNFQVSRNYTLKMNKKNKDYLQKLMEELKHTEKFSVMQH